MKRDFDEYYNKICEQYFQLQEVLKDISNDISNNIVDPNRIEQVKQTILPVENSYRTLSYIKYLLDKPARKSKLKRYNKKSKKLLDISKGHQSTDIINKNADIISNVKI